MKPWVTPAICRKNMRLFVNARMMQVQVGNLFFYPAASDTEPAGGWQTVFLTPFVIIFLRKTDFIHFSAVPPGLAAV
ncbi:hypothetical protein [Desulfonema ishimotonii]|uniref:hypothetical protein n=1 Tax=Desulfonema ishimotonii TaxID=45657 RepID=UPI000F562CA6|nr:hypothetical protein [Desulfonema ishimotonii]